MDRYALQAARALADAVIGDYGRYEFHLVVQRLQTYCSEDLGGFYLDVLKDRLYTAGRDSRARRSAQTGAGADSRSPAAVDRAGARRSPPRRRGRLCILPRRRCSAGSGATRCRRSRMPRRSRPGGPASWQCAASCTRNSKHCASRGRSVRRCRRRSWSPRAADDYAALSRLGDDLRFVTDHLGGTRGPGRRPCDRGHRQRAREVRALLALSRRCRTRSCAFDAVRSLHGELAWRGRGSRACLTRGPAP